MIDDSDNGDGVTHEPEVAGPPWDLGCVCTVRAPGFISLLLRRCQKPRLESDAMMGGSHPGL